MTCAESLPFIAEREIVAQTGDTFVGDRRTRAHVAACGEWVRGTVPRGFTDPVRAETPVVLFSGDVDGATPPWIAGSALRSLPKGRQIVAAHTGHQIDSPCTTNLMQAFIANPSAALDAACAAAVRRPPFATDMPPSP
jgi:hypothetical protein